jgi:opacity protein-like surface antigen
MIRHAAGVALVVVLNPLSLSAQTTGQAPVPTAELRITTGSAVVYKGPSTGSPSLGMVRRGALLPVTRELGSWLKVSWPEAEDGAGYVHVSSGSITRYTSAGPRRASGISDGSPATADVRAEQSATLERPASVGTTYVAPPSHVIGLGGRMTGATFGLGVTGRVWTRNRLGVQVELSRASLTSTAAPGRVTSVQFAPSAIYSFHDHVTDYVWMRPYVGGGANLNRQSWSSGTPEAVDSIKDNTFGFRAFGGGEFTFASVPRFSVSADVGYDWSKSSFTGFDFGGLGFGLSGHWYMR